MTAPVTIPDLDPAGPIDPANDLLLIRQGLNDRKVSAGELSNPSFSTYDMLPGQLVASDLLLIGRNNGISYDNYVMPPQYLGFLNGVRMWFYQASAPLGWTLIPNTGDRLLAVSDGTTNYNAVTSPNQTGTWQQGDVDGVPGRGLSIAQMPAHNHTFKSGHSSEDGLYMMRNKNGGQTSTSSISGSGQAHNHGSIWRPAANVGILCVKDKTVGQ